MTPITLLASKAYTPAEMAGPVAVRMDAGRIVDVSSPWMAVADHVEVVDVRPWVVAPGFIDLHTHGFAGHDVTDGAEEDIAAMAAALPSTGVTAFCPTVASTGPEETLRQVHRIHAVPRRARAAEILGVRLEGPFISRHKKGAQYEAAIRPPDIAEMQRLADSGAVRIVDFAPEEDAEFRLLRMLVERGIVASIGHTAASYEVVMAALEAGARHCTHLFNAMPPLEHRAPGAAGALLSDGRATVELIADGVHVHPAVLRLVVLARGAGSVALVTDALALAGLSGGEQTFVGRRVVVRDGAARLPDGSLAGSVLGMDGAVRTMVRLAQVGWDHAVEMATLTPASIAGLERRKGRLAAGYDADIVVLDGEGEVRQTYCRGELAYAGTSLHPPRG